MKEKGKEKRIPNVVHQRSSVRGSRGLKGRKKIFKKLKKEWKL